MARRVPATLLLSISIGLPVIADDWPEWRGRGRTGEWREAALGNRFPQSGLPVVWRAPVGAGYSGPAVSDGRVFLTDYAAGVERALCFNERTGRQLWTREWPADYKGLDYAIGPRATPTVDGHCVYVLGAVGGLHCLRTRDGALLWSKDYRREWHAELPAWGMSAAPLVVDHRLIAVVGGRPDAKVVAFDKTTGLELWRALPSDTEPGYSQPLLIEAGGARQVVVFHSGGVASLDPASGRLWWEHAWKIHMNTPIATPVRAGPYLLVSAFFQGARMFRLDGSRPAADLIWRGQSESERNTDTLHALMASPLIDGDYIYGICNYGEMRCLRLATGERVWESQAATVEKARNVSAYLVRHRDRTLIFNDRGELILARLAPDGYHELSRVKLIRPTSPAGARRQLGAVAWSHPAFANGRVVVRNDEEVISYSMAVR